MVAEELLIGAQGQLHGSPTLRIARARAVWGRPDQTDPERWTLARVHHARTAPSKWDRQLPIGRGRRGAFSGHPPPSLTGGNWARSTPLRRGRRVVPVELRRPRDDRSRTVCPPCPHPRSHPAISNIDVAVESSQVDPTTQLGRPRSASTKRREHCRGCLLHGREFCPTLTRRSFFLYASTTGSTPLQASPDCGTDRSVDQGGTRDGDRGQTGERGDPLATSSMRSWVRLALLTRRRCL